MLIWKEYHNALLSHCDITFKSGSSKTGNKTQIHPSKWRTTLATKIFEPLYFEMAPPLLWLTLLIDPDLKVIAQRDIFRFDWKGFPGTNTLAYFGPSVSYEEKDGFITPTTGPARSWPLPIVQGRKICGSVYQSDAATSKARTGENLIKLFFSSFLSKCINKLECFASSKMFQPWANGISLF